MGAGAQRRGVTPRALYRHVTGKAGLLDGRVELLLTEFPPPPAGLPWPERLAALAASIRASARRHPSVFPLLLQRPVKKFALIHITADRGLAGGLNTNMNRASANLVLEHQPQVEQVSVLPVGRRGRDPDELVYSAMTGVLVAETETDLRARVAGLLDVLGQGVGDPEAWLADRRRRWIMGTPEQASERVRALEATGMQRVMLQDFLPRDLDHVRLIGRVFRD